MNCRICESRIDGENLIIPEKMFGTGEQFEYIECKNCRCIQIKEIPAEMSDYYPEDYYSFDIYNSHSIKRRLKLKVFRVVSLFKGDFYSKPDFTKYSIRFKERNCRILDVGSGNGNLLRKMKDSGFRKLTGIDPFLKNEIKEPGLKIFKKSIEEVDETFDIIMSHHSLEHMLDPKVFFSMIPKILDQNGRLILRIPVYPNYIWDEYSTDWIQLDAPRHLFTFSIQTVKYLCEKNDLSVDNISFDNHVWSLAATEYCLDGKSYTDFKKNITWTNAQEDKWKASLEFGNGDSVLIIIKHNE